LARQIRPYGSWRSPISADAIAAGVVGLGQVQVDGDFVYWTELRGDEAGRTVIVRRGPDGRNQDVTPPGFNARTRVHEYGGGSYLARGGVVWFTNFADQRLYRQEAGGLPRPITQEADVRHADMVLDERRDRLYAVREDHTTGSQWAVNSLVSLGAGGQGAERTLAAGNDFYSTPRVSPSGSHLCWLTWNHPNMPWDGTELWVAEIGEDGGLRAQRKVAGGPEESIFQPEWSPSGVLYFTSDRSGWWNLYRWPGASVEPVIEIAAELGTTQWLFRASTYDFESEERIVCQVRSNGVTGLALIDTEARRLESMELPYTVYGPSIEVSRGRAFTVASSPSEAAAVVSVDLKTGKVEVLRRSAPPVADPAYFSMPEAIEFPTDGGRTAHAFYHPPSNPEYGAPETELPPLVVYVHGGPTSAVTNALDLEDQFWTSRGFGYLKVNYGGSSGYGRDYRRRLNGQWGVVDVADCVAGVRYLGGRRMVDPDRVAISGGSAGGYTVLRALSDTRVFKAGASHFGVTDLELFHGDTHKFESMYDQSLIGRWPEDRALYRERSPIHSVERISAALIVLQGLEDRIVLPNQAELMVEALRRKGLPVAYLPFEGEHHGFRMAKSIKRALEAELYFYSRVFGFELADPVEPVEIENLPGPQPATGRPGA
jgi:dipeptidyl aminopeptidase/acylaminoacyl peptidase